MPKLDTTSSRVVWIDAAKGLAIALVVLGHVLGSILARHWLVADGPWRTVYDFIYLFHMPLFFMVSGLLLRDAALASPLNALVSRLGSIVWPYFLWDVAIRWALLPFIGRFMLAPPQSTSPLDLLIRAVSGELSWFLWTLFLVQAIYIALCWAPPLLLLLVSMVLSFVLQGAGLGSVQYLVDYLPYLLVGVVVRPFWAAMKLEGHAWQLLAALAVFGLMALVLGHGFTSYWAVRFACGIGGILATIVLVQCIRLPSLVGALSTLGMASLAIYVMHPYFQGAARTLLQAVLGEWPPLHLPLQTLFAIAGPAMVWWLSERYGAGWLFRFPRVRLWAKAESGKRSP